MKIYEKKSVNGLKHYNSAFRLIDTLDLSLYIPRFFGATRVVMHLYGEGIDNKSYKYFNLKWNSLDEGNDVYSCSIAMSEIGIGLYYYKYEVISDKTVFYGEGSSDDALKQIEGNRGLIQLLIYNENENKPDWIYGGVMYHIFVDRFKSSKKCSPKDTAIMNPDWYEGIPQYADVPGGYVENNMFFGGDLYGVIEKLDYIKSLGVNCIYLSPIFEAYSNHKYDTADYMTVDSMFGGEKALDELIIELKKRNMHIILDGVFNHTGSDSIYFNQKGTYDSLGAYQSKSSEYYEWYNFESFPNKYECWWDVKILPRVKSDTPSYQNYILGDGGVIEKWMKKGIDGFRLDVADELSDEFLKKLNNKVKSINPNGIIYGEVWEDASNKIAYDKRKRYFLGNELDSVMNYPLREAIVDYISKGNNEFFENTCKMLYTHYPKANADALMNILGTHDTERILTVLGDESFDHLPNKELSLRKLSRDKRKNAIKKLKMAYTILATVPGVPCIYYGDEAGMEGHRDPFNRLPYPWEKEEKELIDFYTNIGKIRTKEAIYKCGGFKIIKCTSDLLIFARYLEDEFLLTVINRSENKFLIDSNVSLKNLQTNRKINQFSPCSAYILKGKSKIDDLRIEMV